MHHLIQKISKCKVSFALIRRLQPGIVTFWRVCCCMKATQEKKEIKCSFSICTALSKLSQMQTRQKQRIYRISAQPRQLGGGTPSSQEILVFCVQLYEDSSSDLHDCVVQISEHHVVRRKLKGQKSVFKRQQERWPTGGIAAVGIIYLRLSSFLILMSWKGSKCTLWLSVNLQMLLVQNVADGPPDSGAWLCLRWRVCFRDISQGLFWTRTVLPRGYKNELWGARSKRSIHLRGPLSKSALSFHLQRSQNI